MTRLQFVNTAGAAFFADNSLVEILQGSAKNEALRHSMTEFGKLLGNVLA